LKPTHLCARIIHMKENIFVGIGSEIILDQWSTLNSISPNFGQNIFSKAYLPWIAKTFFPSIKLTLFFQSIAHEISKGKTTLYKSKAFQEIRTWFSSVLCTGKAEIHLLAQDKEGQHTSIRIFRICFKQMSMIFPDSSFKRPITMRK
jgi:hypothetical protein